MMSYEAEQVSLFDLDTWSGKMSPEHSAPTKEKTSQQSLKKQSKLPSRKLPMCLYLKKDGLQADASWETSGVLPGEFSMHSFGESPKEGVESHLSQILEVNPHQRYCLSDKACIGILVRANRRGKKLPAMLETALIQQTVGGTEYGQEGIADTIEILRKMRCEIGEEDLKEWVQRTFGSVQPEEVLLSEMCESDEDSEDTNERIVVERDCEEVNGEECLCDLRIGESAGDSPQRREPSEQLTDQLNLLMQKLPHENAQTPIIMYCLRIACEGEEAMSQALSVATQGNRSGADDRYGVPYTLKIRSGCMGGGKGALIQTDKSATLSTLQDQTLFQPVSIENHPADSRVDIDDSGKVQTLTSRMGTGGGNVPMVMEPVTLEPGIAAREGGHIYEGVSGTLRANAGDNQMAVAHPIIAVDQGGGKSGAHTYEGVAPTLTCTHGGEPAVVYGIDQQGGKGGANYSVNVMPPMMSDSHGTPHAVAYEMQAFGKYKDSGLASSLKARDYKDATDLVVAGADDPICIDRAFFNQGKNAKYDPQFYQDGTVPTLVSRGPSAVQVRYIVRRLTPLECERLQGFPDGWTDIGEWIDSKGKKHKEADSPRYKALGNSIALPPWKWVLKRLCACYERDATMASLFDGIGGFPLIWEQINGKGSCLWASEIEEFPMAVTRLRFGGSDNG